jgi:DNA-binding CsgD family transcriptional regulator
MLTHHGSMAGTKAGMPDQLAGAGVTGRVAEVLGAVAERLRNREIAGRLHVSVRTVESYVAALMRKLGLPTGRQRLVTRTAVHLDRGTTLPRGVTLGGRCRSWARRVGVAGCRKSCCLPGLESAVDVSGLGEPELLQG